MEFKFNTIPEILEDIKAGKMVIVVDDADRENEGDLVMAAEKVTPEAINFMAQYGRGLICVPMKGERLEELQIPPMTWRSTDPRGTAFSVSVEAKHKTTTGISAYDRAATILTLVDPRTKPSDLSMPGHTFPLRAREGGVLQRVGHTEAAVDLAKLAGLYPAGVICEILNEDGTMARVPQLMAFAQKHNLKIMTIADLVKYRLKREKLVQKVAQAKLPTLYGNFEIHAYTTTFAPQQHHIALTAGEIEEEEPVLVRVHSECLTGDVLGSTRCDCGEQLQKSLALIQHRGKGVLVYMKQEGRGIGLIAKIAAYALQEQGLDTVQANEKLGFKADLRDYGIGAQILRDLGVRKMELLTNNPKKVVGLEAYGLAIVKQVPIEIPPNAHNIRYLITKRNKLGHRILENFPEETLQGL
jgi:3,4-dihydroxy 2-butanone 4-phosphate synthase/GTP cyclohydrolase II